MSVFISYRRDGGKSVAETIYKKMSKDYDIFLDTESLENGRFDEAIVEKIKKCTDFVMIITEQTFNRCNEPNDWIFQEARLALSENKNIIPVFVGIKAFPSNVPSEIMGVCRYNGIYWNDDATCERLGRFFNSNRRYILSVVRSEDKIALSEETKSELRDLYLRFCDKGRSYVEVDIQIADVDDFSKLVDVQNRYIIEDSTTEIEASIARQVVLRRFKQNKGHLALGIEYMLQDEMLEAYANRLGKRYIEKYGLDNCFFTDSDGCSSDCYIPWLWVDMIEEMLKALLHSRFEEYANSDDYIAIDCSIGYAGYNFKSFIAKQPADPVFEELIEKPIGWNFYCNEIPFDSLMFIVYPDFYYNIGVNFEWMCNAQQALSDKGIKTDVFNFFNYTIYIA
ncbi:MAG: toll/interleukin-1 receptor domain-containing protein [Clostridia bacterium]|nr:toll/interleukin-1 receptor domain-containing protein [Clostridia bacterium]